MGTQTASLTYDLLQLISDDDFASLVQLSEWSQQDIEETLKLIIKVGMDSMDSIRSAIVKEKREKESNQRKREKRNIKNNLLYNIKEQKDISVNYNTNNLSRDPNPEPKKYATSIPKRWVDDRDKGRITDSKLIQYATSKGYDSHRMKEVYFSFVDHNLAKGKKFKDWVRAFYTWIRNDIKFHGPPTKEATLPGSVLKSYKTLNPEEVF